MFHLTVEQAQNKSSKKSNKCPRSDSKYISSKYSRDQKSRLVA